MNMPLFVARNLLQNFVRFPRSFPTLTDSSLEIYQHYSLLRLVPKHVSQLFFLVNKPMCYTICAITWSIEIYRAGTSSVSANEELWLWYGRYPNPFLLRSHLHCSLQRDHACVLSVFVYLGSVVGWVGLTHRGCRDTSIATVFP